MRHRWLQGLLGASVIAISASVILDAQDPASLQGNDPPPGAIWVDSLDLSNAPVRRPRAGAAGRQAAGQAAPTTPAPVPPPLGWNS